MNKALLDGYVAKEEEYKQEIEEWTKENAALKSEVFHATSGAASMVDAVKAEKEAIIAALRMEVQAWKDDAWKLKDELLVDRNANEILRKIITEAKLVSRGLEGVLAGEMAAE